MSWELSLSVIFISLALSWLAGIMDRLRGDNLDFGSALMEKLVYGGIVALTMGGVGFLLGQNVPGPVFFVCIVIGFAAGMSTGWGEPLGALLDRRPQNPFELERWQIGILKKNALLAMIVRGAMTGFWVLPLMYIDPRAGLISLAMMIAMPVAILIARDAAGETEKEKWEMQEFLRGFLFIFLLSFFLILCK